MKVETHIVDVHTTHTHTTERDTHNWERKTCLPQKSVLSGNHLCTGQFWLAVGIFQWHRSIGATPENWKTWKARGQPGHGATGREKNVVVAWWIPLFKRNMGENKDAFLLKCMYILGKKGFFLSFLLDALEAVGGQFTCRFWFLFLHFLKKGNFRQQLKKKEKKKI